MTYCLAQERGDLQKGLSVTLLTGAVVEPHQVMTPPTPGPTLIVVDCPTASHVDALTRETGPLARWMVG